MADDTRDSRLSKDTRGKIKHVGGKIEEKTGELLGDKKMKREGRLRQFEGEAEQDLQRAKERAEEASERKSAAKQAREDS